MGQLRSFASEVTRVAREVGTDGKLGGQPSCPASPAPGRTSPTRSTHVRQPHRPVRNIAHVTTAVARGDLRARSRSTCAANPELKDTITRWDQLNRSLGGDARRARVGTEAARRPAQVPASPVPGRTHRQRQLHGEQPDRQVRNIADVATAIAGGDLSKKITVNVSGESCS